MGPPKTTLLLVKLPLSSQHKEQLLPPRPAPALPNSAPTRKPAMQMPAGKAPPAPSSSSPARRVLCRKPAFWAREMLIKSPRPWLEPALPFPAAAMRGAAGFGRRLVFSGEAKGFGDVAGAGERMERIVLFFCVEKPTSYRKRCVNTPTMHPKGHPAPCRQFRDPLGPTRREGKGNPNRIPGGGGTSPGPDAGILQPRGRRSVRPSVPTAQ